MAQTEPICRDTTEENDDLKVVSEAKKLRLLVEAEVSSASSESSTDYEVTPEDTELHEASDNSCIPASSAPVGDCRKPMTTAFNSARPSKSTPQAPHCRDKDEPSSDAEVPAGEFSDVQKDVFNSTVEKSPGCRVLRFYWLDAIEDPVNKPGTVHLFGKIYIKPRNIYTSCCLVVKNIPRRLHILPAQKIRLTSGFDEEAVREEFLQLVKALPAGKLSSRVVTKKYVFDKDVPRISQYLEVTYPPTYPAVKADNYRGVNIWRIFGGSVNALELLLTKRDIRGPCWLEIEDPLIIPEDMNTSHCDCQVKCTNMNLITVYTGEKLEIPPIIVTAVNVKTVKNRKINNLQVAMIAVSTCRDFRVDQPTSGATYREDHCFATKPEDLRWPNGFSEYLPKGSVTRCECEAEVLKKFLRVIDDIDPDILVVNERNHQLNMLINRIILMRSAVGLNKIGRLRRSLTPYLSQERLLGQQLLAGRPLCDLQFCIKECNFKLRDTSLGGLCAEFLEGQSLGEISPEDCRECYKKLDSFVELVERVKTEASCLMSLTCEMNVIPLAIEMTSVTGNVLSKILSGSKNERNEFLLLHTFHKRGYIAPDKKPVWTLLQEDKRKSKFAGGLVLEATTGTYNLCTLLMDFNSLYPSIMQEYNLCFTTLKDLYAGPLEDIGLPTADTPMGILPNVVREIVERRCEARRLMETPGLSPEMRKQYNVKQLALKLIVNSLVGCFGSVYFRFYARNLAALVAAKGREILRRTKETVESMNFEVIYGDTDSLMINTRTEEYNEVLDIAERIKRRVNSANSKITLDIDGVFRRLVLYNKKKYAGLLVSKLPNGELELTLKYSSLEYLGKEKCKLVHDAGRYALEQILAEAPIEDKMEKIREYVKNIVAQSNIPLQDLVLTKRFSRNYPQPSDANCLVQKPGLLIAMPPVSYTVPYVVCCDGTSDQPAQRAYPVGIVKSRKLQPDIGYYVVDEVIPVLRKICLLFPNIDSNFWFSWMDFSLYEVNTILPHGHPKFFLAHTFKPLILKCEKCSADIELRGFTKKGVPMLLACPSKSCSFVPWTAVYQIRSTLASAVRACMDKYTEEKVLVCDNRRCLYSVEDAELRDLSSTCPQCFRGKLQKNYSEYVLHNELRFYYGCFNVEGQRRNVKERLLTEAVKAYDILAHFLEKCIRKIPYGVVAFSSPFSCSIRNKL